MIPVPLILEEARKLDRQILIDAALAKFSKQLAHDVDRAVYERAKAQQVADDQKPKDKD